MRNTNSTILPRLKLICYTSHAKADPARSIEQPQQPNDVVLTTHSEQLSGWAARHQQCDATVAPRWPRGVTGAGPPWADRPAGWHLRLKTTNAMEATGGVSLSVVLETLRGGSGDGEQVGWHLPPRGKCRKVEMTGCGFQTGKNKDIS